jgi:hypothetical protein
MSDSLADFQRKTDAMFDKAIGQQEEIARRYVMKLATLVVKSTPGPNLQLPWTEYIATGRLRAGWSYDLERVSVAHKWESGPYSDTGDEALAEIRAAVFGGPLPAVAYLNNDVAYGIIVHDGLGRMPVDRPWVGDTAGEAERLADEARREVMAEG